MADVVAFRNRDDLPAHLHGLGPATDRVWAAGSLTGLFVALAAAFLFPRHGVALAYLSVLLRLSWYAVRSEQAPALRRLLQFGLVAGLFALFNDYVRAQVLPEGRLVYLTRDAVLLATPPYVPLGWACAVVEVGYLPLRLHAQLRGPRSGLGATAVASVLAAAMAGLGMGLIEVLAVRAGWWKYESTHAMLAPSVAAYAPLGEGLAFLALVPLFQRALRGGVVFWGIAFAACALGAQLLAWWVLR
ncbi:MAG TPA: hypothetical protein VFV75_10645 [Candidatus Polarisedimenticolaceae bacterium]|nr:hypothetical protein [Candidatus Polarisedimenticolaceae bacterium]